MIFVQNSNGYAEAQEVVVSPGNRQEATQDYSSVISKIQEHLKLQNTNLVAKEIQKQNPDKKLQESESIEGKITCQVENNLAKVTVQFSEQAPLAIFRQENDWFIFIAYPTTLKTPAIDYDKIPDITHISDIDIENGRIIKICLSRRLTPEVKQKGKDLTLVFKPNLSVQDNAPLVIQAPTRIKDPFLLHIPRKTSLLIYVDESTQRHFIILCSGEETKSVNQYNYPEFVMLESLQGFAFELLSDSLEYEITKKVFKVKKPDGIAVSLASTSESLVDHISVFSGFNALQAANVVEELLEETFKSSKNIISNNIQLCWYYLGLGKIPEAIAIINRLKESNSDLALIPAFSSLDGLAQLLANRPEKAEQSLQLISYDTEPLFWGLIAKANKNIFLDTEQFYQLSNYKDKLALLPSPLKARLLSNVLLIASLQKNYEVLKAYVNERIPSKDEEVKTVMQLGQALLDFNNDQPDLAQPVLEKLATLEWHPKVQTIARLALLRDFDEKDETLVRNRISALEKLRFNWRGDLLEYQITKYLVEQLISEKRYPVALSVLRKLVAYFPEQSLNDKLPQIMQQQLLAYFSQETPVPFLEALSVFQEFGDIAPNNSEGDKIMLDTTRKMVKVGLTEEAIGLLDDYLKTKLQKGDNLTERRNSIQLQIIAYQKKDKKYDLALDKNEHLERVPVNLIDDIQVMKADILQKMGKTREALNILKATPLQQLKKGSLYFNHKQWQEASKCYENVISTADTLTPEQYDKGVTNLALCYALLQKHAELKELIERYADKLTSTENKNILKILQLSPTPQQQASEYFSQIDELTQALKKTFKS